MDNNFSLTSLPNLSFNFTFNGGQAVIKPSIGMRKDCKGGKEPYYLLDFKGTVKVLDLPYNLVGSLLKRSENDEWELYSLEKTFDIPDIASHTLINAFNLYGYPEMVLMDIWAKVALLDKGKEYDKLSDEIRSHAATIIKLSQRQDTLGLTPEQRDYIKYLKTLETKPSD